MTGGPQRRRGVAITIAVMLLAIAGGLAVWARFRHDNRPHARIEKVIAELERFTNDICECRDQTCVQGVSDRMSRWGQDMAAHHHYQDQPDNDQMKRVQTLTERMMDCMSKLTPNRYESQEGGVNGAERESR
jgi:hypothetical protein